VNVTLPLSEPARAPAAVSSRVASVDLIRGAVMILMAIDHVRVYAGVPAGGPPPPVFFTRWITHFCAPAFVFLAGTSAFFYARKHPGVSRFLVTRGLWLVVLELTVLRVAWTFNLDFGWQMAGVIWAIGWCMVVLGALVHLRPAVVAAIGLVIMAGHNLLDPVLADQSVGAFWKILYVGFWQGPIQYADGASFVVLYAIVPWIGVMAAGYGFGEILRLDPARRDRICLRLGLGATALFLVLRAAGVYGDPRPWSPGQGPLGFLNTTKYPASLLFLLMTLGPTIALIPLLEKTRGRLAAWVTVFGRVPFFYYVLHIPLIHALALGISAVRSPDATWWLLTNHPMGNPPPPDGYAWGLPLLYLIWLMAIGMLYFPCRWFAELKVRRKDWWLRYL
jgi:uncharacterized membrane protein